MTATLHLPRVLANVAKAELVYQVEGKTLKGALEDLFEKEPRLRGHLLDESGNLRPHVSMFVGRDQADLDTAVVDGVEIRVLQAVSGG